MKNMILPVQVFPPAAGSKDDFTETWFYRIKTVDAYSHYDTTYDCAAGETFEKIIVSLAISL